jgi:hypothetical protein
MALISLQRIAFAASALTAAVALVERIVQKNVPAAPLTSAVEGQGFLLPPVTRGIS